MKKISQFPQITDRDNDDWLLIEEASTGTYKKIKISDFIAGLGEKTPQDNSVLDCSFEGANNSTSFIDAKGNSINVIGNTKISTDQKRSGNSSGYFDGINSALTIPINSNLSILSGDFKLEIGFYPIALSGLRPIIAQWQQALNKGGFLLAISNSNLMFYFGAYSESNALLSGGTINSNIWNFVELVRLNNNFSLSLNGSVISSVVSSVARTPIDINLSLGNYYNSSNAIGAAGANYFSGYIDDLRIVK